MKLWKTASVDQTRAANLASVIGLPIPVAAVLLARGFADSAQNEGSEVADHYATSRESIQRFLNPRLSDLSDPFLLPDMRKAVERIWRAIDRRETIAIYGDYDVDGVSATALLLKVLKRLGATAVPFLPRRLDEGYGLTTKALLRCIGDCRPKLIVTVDCGTNSATEVKLASERGVEVIITDHHEAAETIAAAAAVVNPTMTRNDRISMLAGVGVAFKLCHALIKHDLDTNRSGGAKVDLREYLDLVALGTVADIVPLVGENRILTHHGLIRLNRTDSTGLKALIAVAGIEGEIGCYQIGFMLGPRLNAAGRLDSADHALELLVTEDKDRASELARRLDTANRERKRVEEIIVTEAVEEIDSRFDGKRDFGIATGREGWHPGAIGIAASRLSGRYHRPAAVVAFDKDGCGRGSCRSIEGADVTDILRKCASLLITFGGHKMAAGFQIKKDNLDMFRDRFNESCAEVLRGSDLRPSQTIDAWLCLGEADKRLHAAIQKLKPFGIGNPTPTWGAANMRIVGQPRILKEKHLKMTLASGGTQMEAIAFGMANRELPDGPLDIAFQLDQNTYMDRTRLQLVLKDFRASEG